MDIPRLALSKPGALSSARGLAPYSARDFLLCPKNHLMPKWMNDPLIDIRLLALSPVRGPSLPLEGYWAAARDGRLHWAPSPLAPTVRPGGSRSTENLYFEVHGNRRLGTFDPKTKTAPDAGRRCEHGRERPGQGRERQARRSTSRKHHTE